MQQRVTDDLKDGTPFWLTEDGVLNKRDTRATLDFYLDQTLITTFSYASNGNPTVGHPYFLDCSGEMEAVQGSPLSLAMNVSTPGIR